MPGRQRIPFGFCEPSYQLTNKFAAVERTINWTLAPNETRGSESHYTGILEPTPGTIPFGPLPVPRPFNQRVRGLLGYRGLVFGVSGTAAWYTKNLSLAGGLVTCPASGLQFLGLVVDDGSPVSIVGNGSGQIFVSTASGNGYVIYPTFTDLSTNPGFLGSSYCTFQDGYIIVVTPRSQLAPGAYNQIQISGTMATPVGDATQWDASFISEAIGQSDVLKAVISSREFLRLMGAARSQVFYNSGATFPFVSYNSTYIEHGTMAPFSVVDLGDSLMWLGQDYRGVTACFRDFAFAPEAVSTWAIEQQWTKYPIPALARATAFSYVWQGHKKYQITFPQAVPPSDTGGAYLNATWEYDATASRIIGKPVWTELQFQRWDGVPCGLATPYHAFLNFSDASSLLDNWLSGWPSAHIVGSDGSDGNPGALYQLSANVFTNAAADPTGNQYRQPIIRTRITPHLYDSDKRIQYNRLTFDCTRGVGAIASAATSAASFTVTVTDADGHTASVTCTIPAGCV